MRATEFPPQHPARPLPQPARADEEVRGDAVGGVVRVDHHQVQRVRGEEVRGRRAGVAVEEHRRLRLLAGVEDLPRGRSPMLASPGLR